MLGLDAGQTSFGCADCGTISVALTLRLRRKNKKARPRIRATAQMGPTTAPAIVAPEVPDAGAEGPDVGDARVVLVVGIGPAVNDDSPDVELVLGAVGVTVLGTNRTSEDTGNVEVTTPAGSVLRTNGSTVVAQKYIKRPLE